MGSSQFEPSNSLMKSTAMDTVAKFDISEDGRLTKFHKF